MKFDLQMFADKVIEAVMVSSLFIFSELQKIQRKKMLVQLLSQQKTNETLQKMQIQLLQKMELFVHHQWQKLKSHRHLLCQKVMQSLIN